MSDVETRFIVLGMRDDIDQWRRTQGLPTRAVIAACSPHALRGFSGPFMLVTLPSIEHIAPKTLLALRADIDTIQATAPTRRIRADSEKTISERVAEMAHHLGMPVSGWQLEVIEGVYAQSQRERANTGQAIGQCVECGSYRSDGLPPALHEDGCSRSD